MVRPNLSAAHYGQSLGLRMICIGLCHRTKDWFRLSTRMAGNVQLMKRANCVFSFQILIASIILTTRKRAQEYSVMDFFIPAIWPSDDKTVAYAYSVASPTW